MLNKLLVLVPYRNRKNHLDIFVPYIHQSLKDQNISYSLVIVEQSSLKPFNRGLLFNAGFKYFSKDHNYTCLHDVDIIGEPFDYSYTDSVVHLAAKQRDRNYVEWYKECLGGTTLFPSHIFSNINGFSNKYWGWGCEDDDLRIRCEAHGYKITRRICKYYQLYHEKSGWHTNHTDDTYKANRKIFDTFEKNLSIDQQKQVTLNDGINQVEQYIINQNIFHTNNNYTLLSLTV